MFDGGNKADGGINRELLMAKEKIFWFRKGKKKTLGKTKLKVNSLFPVIPFS